MVGHEVVQAVQNFFLQRLVMPHFNSNLLILIPKVPGVDTVSQFRPIALANFVFRSSPKFWLTLLPIAPHIISHNQNAFVKGCSITDSIILTLKCMKLLDLKCIGGNVAIKFDIQKAFDTLDWGFILHVLTAFGFGEIFVSWIK